MSNVNMLYFIGGGMIGAGISYFLAKKHFEKVADAEIEAIRDLYAEKKNDAKEQEHEEPKLPVIEKADVKIVEDIAARQGYRKPYGSYFNGETSEKPKAKNRIRLISPDDFGEIEEYAQIIMEYYAKNDILAYASSGPRGDEDIVNNREEIIGTEALKNFGKYDENFIHVVNEERQTYYEIERIQEAFETDED